MKMLQQKPHLMSRSVIIVRLHKLATAVTKIHDIVVVFTVDRTIEMTIVENPAKFTERCRRWDSECHALSLGGEVRGEFDIFFSGFSSLQIYLLFTTHSFFWHWTDLSFFFLCANLSHFARTHLILLNFYKLFLFRIFLVFSRYLLKYRFKISWW